MSDEFERAEEAEVPLTWSDKAKEAYSIMVKAVRLRLQIQSLEPLSNEHILAKSEFEGAVSQCNKLFCEAFEECDEPVLKHSIRLQLNQIAVLLDPKLNDTHKQRYGVLKR